MHAKPRQEESHSRANAGEPTAPAKPTDRRLRRGARVLVPLMLFGSSLIMAFAWLGHLRLKSLSYGVAIALAWALVLPEYALNVGALRLGYGRFTGGQMAAFRLCSGVFCVALVSRFVLDEPLSGRKVIGFALMVVAMLLVARRDEGASEAAGAEQPAARARSSKELG